MYLDNGERKIVSFCIDPRSFILSLGNFQSNPDFIED
jgi:hypothetical protein